MKLLISAFVLVLTAFPALAGTAVTTDHARSNVILENDGVAPGGTIAVAFAQQLEPGWHVYWKNPGDSGLPLDFQWTLPPGAAAGDIAYPAPHRIPIGPLVNFGHEGAPVFLTSLTAPADAAIGGALDIALDATWLICAEICVPETGSFSFSVPVVENPRADDSVADFFAAARAASPQNFPGEASFSVNGSNIALNLDGAPDAGEAYFFPAEANVSEPAAPQKAKRQGNSLVLAVKGGAAAGGLGDRLDGVIAFGAGDEARAYEVSAARGAAGAAPSMAGSLAGLLFAAFIGGAILNLMPCVFPILFVKAASLAKSASGDAGIARRHGVLYGAGVVATFAVLGGLMLALRAGGESVGWGFHLQSPAVIALSAYVLFAVGLNFSGVFHVGGGLQGVGSDLVAGKSGDVSAFLTGILAVFVAAPCVGPFLTAPVGAAAVLPPLQGFSIFIAMAAGLAAPYVALSFAPGLAKALPKPGPWMETFRQILAFPVFAAAAYFLWVLAAQTGQRGLALGFAGLLALALAARLWGLQHAGRKSRLAALLLLALSLAPLMMLRPVEAASTSGEIRFDPADVAARRAAGEAVFIDFTAAWCVTCQVNKLTVFSSPKVRQAFEDHAVAFVTADWTNRDAAIEAALASFGANGVPLYVYYPPQGEAVVLPQPLTAEGIVSVIGK